MLDCPAGGLCGGGGQVFSRAALKAFLAQGGLFLQQGSFVFSSGSSTNPLLALLIGRDAFLEEQRSEAEAIGGWGDVANCRVAAKRDIPIRLLA